jgi:hypothetical protein
MEIQLELHNMVAQAASSSKMLTLWETTSAISTVPFLVTPPLLSPQPAVCPPMSVPTLMLNPTSLSSNHHYPYKVSTTRTLTLQNLKSFIIELVELFMEW